MIRTQNASRHSCFRKFRFAALFVVFAQVPPAPLVEQIHRVSKDVFIQGCAERRLGEPLLVPQERGPQKGRLKRKWKNYLPNGVGRDFFHRLFNIIHSQAKTSVQLPLRPLVSNPLEYR